MSFANYFWIAFYSTGGVLCAVAISALAALFVLWLNSLTERK